jgi:mRNA-degrading endonuclease RelE of RelBE toxin-antitoxin system
VTYRVEFTATARRDIGKLPPRIACAVLELCAGPLAENPHRVGKPLLGQLTGLHSARRGTCCVSYAIEDERVVIGVTTRSSRAYLSSSSTRR